MLYNVSLSLRTTFVSENFQSISSQEGDPHWGYILPCILEIIPPNSQSSLGFPDSQGEQHEPGPETKLPQCPALESGRQWFLIFNLLAPVPRDLGSNQTIVLHAVKLSWKTTNLWFEKWLLARAIRSYLCPELIIKKWTEHRNEHETHPPIWVTGTYSFPNISPSCPHLPPTAIRQVS